MLNYNDVYEIERANRNAGQCWFSLENIHFHKSKTYGVTYKGRYFVSSEADFHGVRKYSVREVTSKGHIENASENGEFDTKRQADAFALKLEKSTWVKHGSGYSGGSKIYVWKRADIKRRIYQVTRDKNPPTNKAGYFNLKALLALKNCNVFWKW